MPRHHKKGSLLQYVHSTIVANTVIAFELCLLYVFGDDAFRNIQNKIVNQINLPCLACWALMTDVCHSFFHNQFQGSFGKVAGYHS